MSKLLKNKIQDYEKDFRSPVSLQQIELKEMIRKRTFVEWLSFITKRNKQVISIEIE